MGNERKNSQKEIHNKLDYLAQMLEKASIAEYVAMYRHPWKMLWTNFLLGVMRGFGFAVGFTVVGAFFLYAVSRVAALNLPIVGEFIAEIARIVQEELGGTL